MPLKFFGYAACGTCRKAQAYLNKKKIAHEFIDITQTPPPKTALKAALAAGYGLKDLFNKSGQAYRELNIKDKLPKMTEAQALDLLACNGRLVKRPVMTDGKRVTVGFDEAAFKKAWG